VGVSSAGAAAAGAAGVDAIVQAFGRFRELQGFRDEGLPQRLLG
jgi:hypothetical protein